MDSLLEKIKSDNPLTNSPQQNIKNEQDSLPKSVEIKIQKLASYFSPEALKFYMDHF